MKGFNKVILAGNVGRDPQIQTFDGRKKASFSLATTNKYRGEDGSLREITDWHNIVVWGNLADIVEGYVRKGTPLLIEGRLRYREYDDKDNIRRRIAEIIVNSLVLLSGKQEDVPEITGSSEQGYGGLAMDEDFPGESSSPFDQQDVDDLPF